MGQDLANGNILDGKLQCMSNDSYSVAKIRPRVFLTSTDRLRAKG